MARAGVFVSIEVDGSLCIERGYVRPEDEPVIESEDGEADAVCGVDGASAGVEGDTLAGTTETNVVPIGTTSGGDDAEDGEILKPLPDRLVAEQIGSAACRERVCQSV